MVQKEKEEEEAKKHNSLCNVKQTVKTLVACVACKSAWAEKKNKQYFVSLIVCWLHWCKRCLCAQCAKLARSSAQHEPTQPKLQEREIAINCSWRRRTKQLSLVPLKSADFTRCFQIATTIIIIIIIIIIITITITIIIVAFAMANRRTQYFLPRK